MQLPRPPLSRTVVLDAALALVLVPLSLGAIADARDHLPLALPLLLLASLPLAVRRRRPWLAFGLTLAATVAVSIATAPVSIPFALIVALYSVAVYEPATRARAAAAAAAIGLTAVMLTTRTVDLAPALMLATAFAIGTTLRARRAYLRDVEERAERLERERDEQARQAVAAERARIARELHDVIAHNVSIVVVHANAAARIFKRGPERGLEALEAIEATARQTLAELRNLLGVMRDLESPDAELAPQPRLAELQVLIGDLRGLGLDVDLAVEGERRELAAGVELSAFRIVQEALTNTVKHGAATRAQVRLRYGSDDLELEIADDGRASPNGSGSSGGHGLLGMRERVLLYGGDFEAGPRPEGGFRVSARLPLESAR